MLYVDPMRPCIRTRTWRWPKSCHLYADTWKELHDFAALCGLRHSWFQGRGAFPHYDLTEPKRAVAVSLGAAEHTAKQMVAWRRARDMIV